MDFDADKLKENLEALLVALKKAKPTQAKGVYIKKVSISTTMGAGVAVDQAGLNASAKVSCETPAVFDGGLDRPGSNEQILPMTSSFEPQRR